MPLPHPVIVVPGITATCLRDEYPIPPEDIWKVTLRGYERFAMHPDDLRYEALEPARVRPGEVFAIVYEDLIEELRYNLSPRADRPVPVYPFSYDWRRPLAVVEAQLAGFVAEVIDRTKLLKHYRQDGYGENPKVNLVGHSMGGLVVAGYLEKEKKRAPVDKVVTLAAPFQGSFEAVIKVITGTASLGPGAPSSREREAARMTPALYHLVPSFSRGIEVDASLPDSLFDPALWQPGVVASIAEFIRKYGAAAARDRTAQARLLFQTLLDEARRHCERLRAFKLSDAGLSADRWLAVVGVDTETRVRLQIVKRGNRPFFDLRGKDRANEWKEEAPLQRRLTGDGTVPYEGAVPTFLPEKNLVLVTPDDFGYWEVRDRFLNQAAGFHGMLPNMNMLHRLIVRFFTGRHDKYRNTWGRPAPGVSEADWKPPLDLRPKS